MNLKRELRGTCGPVAQLVPINSNSEQQGSDFFHLYIYVRMAYFTFRVIPGNMSYVCTLESFRRVDKDLWTRFKISHWCLVQYNLEGSFKKCSRLTAYSVLRRTGWKSLPLLKRDQLSPKKCPLIKPVSLLLIQMHFLTGDRPKDFTEERGQGWTIHRGV